MRLQHRSCFDFLLDFGGIWQTSPGVFVIMGPLLRCIRRPHRICCRSRDFYGAPESSNYFVQPWLLWTWLVSRCPRSRHIGRTQSYLHQCCLSMDYILHDQPRCRQSWSQGGICMGWSSRSNNGPPLLLLPRGKYLHTFGGFQITNFLVRLTDELISNLTSSTRGRFPRGSSRVHLLWQRIRARRTRL